MSRALRRVATLPLLAATLAVWGCSDTRDPITLTGPEPSFLTSDGGLLKGYTVVRESEATGSVSGVIGEAGGKLMLGKHELWVPKGAVSAPTTFTMEKLQSDMISVRLSATQTTFDDVGEAGFPVPVKLVLSYQNAEDQIGDPSLLQIVWLKPDGTTEIQMTELDVLGKRVVGYLWHFSDYALALPF